MQERGHWQQIQVLKNVVYPAYSSLSRKSTRPLSVLHDMWLPTCSLTALRHLNDSRSVLCGDEHLASAAPLFLLELPRISATLFLQRSSSHRGILGFLQRTVLIKTSGDNTLGLSRLRKTAARTLLLMRNDCRIVRLCGA